MSERGNNNPLPPPPPSATGEGRGGAGADGEIGRDSTEQIGDSGKLDVVIAPAIAIASLVLYLRTLAPGVVDADGGEFQFAAWNFSFVHPTGYPLFLILGGVAQHLLPVGDPAYRLNVFTALTAALAVGMLYLAIKELAQRRIAAAIAALSFALTRTFWFDAGAAEVYDLNVLFLALLLFIALRWQASPSARKIAVFCFVYGLALTHHRTMILWVPAFALFFAVAGLEALKSISPSGSPLTRAREKGMGRIGDFVIRVLAGWTKPALLSIVLFLLPFLLYLYLPLRAPASPYAVLSLSPNHSLVLYDNSASGFLNYVFGRAFQHEIAWDATSLARLGMLPQWSLEQFGAPGIILGLLGLSVMSARKEWARLVLLLAGTIATVVFASLYHIGDIAHYYVPAYLVWAVWMGVGVAAVGAQVERPRTTDRRPRPDDRQPTKDEGQLSGAKEEGQIEAGGLQSAVRGHPSAVRSLVVFALLGIGAILLAFEFATNLGPADRSGETQARDQWDRILAEPIPSNAILLSNDRDEMMPLWYIQYVENRRRDLLGLFPLITPAPEHGNIVRLVDSIWDVNRPIYLIKPMPGLEIKYRLSNADAPLVQVEGRTADTPPSFASNALLGDRVRVIGYDVERQAQNLRVAIYWRPFDRLEYDYTTFVQLVDERGQKIAQGIDHKVGGEFYPTTMWDPGQVLRDEQTVALPAGRAPQKCRLIVGMYRQPEMDLLGEPVAIGTIDLK